MRYENKTREELIKELKILRKKYEKNISECKALKDSAEYLKILFDYAPDGYYINDLKGNFIDGNKAAEKITGYQKEELIGKSFFQLGILSKKDIPKAQKAIKRNKKGLSTPPEEYTIHRKDKSEIAVEISTYPAKIKGKMVVLGIARDITKRKQAETAFKKNKYNLTEAQRMAHIGSWDLNLFSNTLTWSDEVYRIFGLKPQQFKATYEAFLENVHPDDREQVNQAYTESVEKKIPYNIVHRLVPKNGITKYVNECCQTYYDDNGKPIRSIGTVQDITQRMQAGKKLKESENRLKQLFENAPVCIEIYDKKGFFVHANKAWDTLWEGISKEDLIGKYNALKSEQVGNKGLLKYIKRAYAGETVTIPLYEFDPREEVGAEGKGRIKWVSSRIYPINDNDGQLTNIILINEDLTDLKETQDKLKHSYEYLEQLTDSMPDIIFSVKMPERTIEWVNDAFKQTGYDPKACIGRTSEFLYVEKSEYIKNGEKIKETIAQGKNTFRSETLLKRKNGEIFPAEFTETYFVENGKSTRITGILRDITERKESEKKLIESEEKFRSISNQATAGITLSDLKGNYLFVNSAFCKMSGYTQEELLKLTVFDMGAKNKNPKHLFKSKKNIDGSINRTNLAKKDGTEYITEITGTKIKIDNEDFILGTIRDVTKREEAERQLKILESAVASSINAIALSDIKGNLTYANSSFLKMWGYENEKEVLSHSVMNFWQREADAGKVVEKLFAKGSWIGELIARRKDGSIFTAQLSANVVKNKHGKPINMMASFIDITEIKKAQEMLMEGDVKLHALFYKTNYALGISKNGITTMVNPAYLRLFGYDSNTELKGKSLFDNIAPEKHAQILEIIRLRSKKGDAPSNYETLGIRQDGSIFDMGVNVSTYELNGEVYSVAFLNDITERKKIEKERIEHAREIAEALQSTISSISATIELRDPYTSGHQKRTTQLACAIAKELNLDNEKTEGIRLAGLLFNTVICHFFQPHLVVHLYRFLCLL